MAITRISGGFVTIDDLTSNPKTISGIVLAAGQQLIAGFAGTGTATVTSIVWNGTENLTNVTGMRAAYHRTPSAGTFNLVLTLSAASRGIFWYEIVTGLVASGTPHRTVLTGTNISLTGVESANGDRVYAHLGNTFGDGNHWNPLAGTTEVVDATASPGVGGATPIDGYVGYKDATGATTDLGWQVDVSDGNSAKKMEAVAFIGTALPAPDATNSTNVLSVSGRPVGVAASGVVTAKDSSNVAIQGASITMSTDGTGSFSPSSGTTDVNGQFAYNYTPTAIGDGLHTVTGNINTGTGSAINETDDLIVVEAVSGGGGSLIGSGLIRGRQ